MATLKIKKITEATKAKDIKRVWHLVNVEGKTLGRVATTIATTLMGKTKPYFIKSLDCGDFVVVTNAKKIQVTGKKESEKMYGVYSGYPGGLKSESFKSLLVRRPDEIIRRAVYGMLPKNKLRDSMIKRLFIYADEQHSYKDKFQVPNSKSQANLSS